MWGVMHDGTTTYEGVLDVVQKLKQQGKDLIILSNSSKRQDNSIKMLKKLGFDPATSSAPFVATLVDVTGLVIYFSLAFVILRGTLL